MILLIRILEELRPGAEWTLLGEEYTGLTWLDAEQTKPTEEEIADLREAIETAIETERVDNLRREAYQLRADPLFFKWQRGEATQQEWQAEVSAIREEFPQ